MNTQVNTFPDRVKIKADLARFSVCQLSPDSSQGSLTTSKRSRAWAETSLNNAWPSCVIVGASNPKRLHLVHEVSNEVIKKVDLPGDVVHVAMHENFFTNGQIFVVYADPDNPLKLRACILKYDGTKKSVRRYPDITHDTQTVGKGCYTDTETGETTKSSTLDAQDVFLLSTAFIKDSAMTPKTLFNEETRNIHRTRSSFAFRTWSGSDEGSITAEHVVARNMSNMRAIQFFKYKKPGCTDKFLQLSDMHLVSRYRRGTDMLSSSDSARLGHKFIHTSRRTVLDIDVNQNWISILMPRCDEQNLVQKESYAFFPYRTPSIRYSEYSLEKAMMLFKLPENSLSLSCNRNKVFVATGSEVHVYDGFQSRYTESVSTNKGVIADDRMSATVKSLLPTKPEDVSYFNVSWEDLLKRVYVGSLDDANEVSLGDPATIYNFGGETVCKVKAHGSDPFDMMCVHTLKFGETSENRKHKSDTLYVYLAGRLIFKKSFSNGISSFKPYIVSVADEGNRENCFTGTSVKEVCVDICLDEKTFLSFDVFPERSTVEVRDIQREQVQTRTVSAPQLSRFIDF